MTAAAPERPNQAPGNSSRALLEKIRGVQRKQFQVAVGLSVVILVCAAIVGLAAGLWLDWWFDLSLSVRMLILALETCGLVVVLVLLLRRFRSLPDAEAVAFLVERFDRRFDGRLISVLQLTRGANGTSGSNGLVQALVRETEELAAPVRFRKAVRTERLEQLSVLAVALMLAAVAAYTAGGQTVRDLLRRTFLENIPVPRRTRVVETGGDQIVGRGNSVVLAATAQGIVPRTGRVTLRYGSGRVQTLALGPRKERRSRFERQLENVTESFSYQIRLNDGLSPELRVRVVPLPTSTRLEAEQVFPRYTGLKPARRALGDLALLAGSTLRLQATANKPLSQATVRLVGLGQDLPMHIEGASELSVEFPIPTNLLSGFSLQLVDQDGVASRDAAVYRIDIVPDRPPAVRVIHPERKEELVTTTAILLVAFEATDDFSLSRAGLRYQSEALTGESPRVIELDLGGAPLKSLRRRYEWKMASFQPLLPEGSVVEYWIEVQDNNTDTGPGRGASEHFLAKVVSENEKRADLLNRVDDVLGNIDEVALDQEKLNRNLGTLILERTQ